MATTKSAEFDRELDISGEVCPFTFVKSKLALETMNSGQILRVVIDHPPAVTNVPQSLRSEGHEVLGVDEAGPQKWHIRVKKA